MQCFKYNSHGNQICSGADSLPVLLIPQFVPPRRANQRLSMNVRQKTLMHLLLRAASRLFNTYRSPCRRGK